MSNISEAALLLLIILLIKKKQLVVVAVMLWPLQQRLRKNTEKYTKSSEHVVSLLNLF